MFYADIARDSYAAFKRLKDAGTIPAGTRFQVDLVPAHSVIWLFLADALHGTIDPIYNEALKREIDKIAAAIPPHDLAIQFEHQAQHAMRGWMLWAEVDGEIAKDFRLLVHDQTFGPAFSSPGSG